MRFTSFLTILSFAPLLLAAPVPNPQIPAVINPSGGPAKSIIADRVNGFINRFSTRPNVLSIVDGPAPVASSDGTTVDGQLDLKPVEGATETVPEGQADNVLKLRPVDETVDVVEAPEDDDEEEFVVVPSAVTSDAVTA